MDEAKRLAQHITDLDRRLRAFERGSQLGKSSIRVGGEPIPLAQGIAQGMNAGEKATAAAAAAAEAMLAANTAAESADGKNRITHSLAAPTAADGAGRTEGDTWFRYNSVNQILGQWRWTGSAWTPQQISSAMITNLDAGKITAGTISAALTVTGALVATSATVTGVYRTATSGRRVEMNSDPAVVGSLRFYASNAADDAGTLEVRSMGVDAIRLELRSNPFAGKNEGSIILDGGNGQEPRFLLHTRASDGTSLASIEGGRNWLTLTADKNISLRSETGSVVISSLGQAATTILGARYLDLLGNQDINIISRDGTTFEENASLKIQTANVWLTSEGGDISVESKVAKTTNVYGGALVRVRSNADLDFYVRNASDGSRMAGMWTSVPAGNTGTRDVNFTAQGATILSLSNRIQANRDVHLNGGIRLTGGWSRPTANGAAPGIASGSNASNTIWFAWHNNALEFWVDSTLVYRLPGNFPAV